MVEDNMQKKNLTMAFATIKMPDGKEHEIPLPSKIFSSGRSGFYSQISSFVYDGDVYGGQIQIWKKTPK